MTFLRTHIIDISNLQLRHSKRFRLTHKQYNQISDRMIIEQEPYVYRRFEDDFNGERLLIRWSWTLLIFALSFLLLLSSLFFLYNQLISYSLILLSILLFLTGIFCKFRNERFTWNIDFSRHMITDEIINKVREDLLTQQNTTIKE